MKIFFTLIILFLIACKNDNKESIFTKEYEKENIENTDNKKQSEFDIKPDTVEKKVSKKSKILNKNIPFEVANEKLNKEEFVKLKDLSDDFVYDIKYATSDNFLKQAVYDCPECFLRKETALALIKASQAFKVKGYKILIYDCYRPLDVQKKMWTIMPGTNYVADPKKGSKHNRGAAVDLTLIDENGKILDMGTTFDFFGKEAHHTYTKLPKEVLFHRKLLKDVLTDFNFRHISSEWWHYEYRPEMDSSVSNYKWDCQ